MSPDILSLLVLAGSFFCFALFHSILAADSVKNWFAAKLKNYFAFYRLTYNLISLLSFYLVYEFTPRPYAPIYELPTPYDFLILIPQMISLLFLLYSLKFVDKREFLGIGQVVRFFNKKYSPAQMDDISILRLDGPYKFSRHPIYLFTTLFLLFRSQMDLFDFSFLILIIAYFYIGSIFEERKLIKKYGALYESYRSNTGRIFPKIMR